MPDKTTLSPSSVSPLPAAAPGAAAFPGHWLPWFLLSTAICYRTAIDTASLSWNDSRYNYVLVAILVALVLLYQEREFLFPATPSREMAGAILGGVALAANLIFTYAAPGVDLFWRYLALALCWIGGLWYWHGSGSLREALFQVLMLLAAAPLPEAWLEAFEVFLQHTSADTSEVIFRLLSTPVYREGLVFSLPGLNIEVARECSGIRSTTALILVVAVCGHLLLRKGSSKLIFLLLSIPAGIVKNAVRIVILAWLGSNVSPTYLDGPLHRQGGPLFTLTAVAILGPALWLLMRMEKRPKAGDASPSVAAQSEV